MVRAEALALLETTAASVRCVRGRCRRALTIACAEGAQREDSDVRLCCSLGQPRDDFLESRRSALPSRESLDAPVPSRPLRQAPQKRKLMP
jgi:hypothetical protein